MRRQQIRALRVKIANFLILYFLVFTLNFTTNTFSKYAGQINGNKSMSVAKWSVSVNDEVSSKNISLVAGNTMQEYAFNVISNSEIAANYDIILTNIPNDVKVSLDGGTIKTPTNNRVEFTNAGSFTANQASRTNAHVLKFETTIDTAVQNNTSVNLEIVFEQEEI